MFADRNWREEVEFTAHCSTKRATFLLSLRDFAERGQGQPAPNDLKIGNWHSTSTLALGSMCNTLAQTAVFRPRAARRTTTGR
jgi:hypothetical protein